MIVPGRVVRAAELLSSAGGRKLFNARLATGHYALADNFSGHYVRGQRVAPTVTANAR